MEASNFVFMVSIIERIIKLVIKSIVGFLRGRGIAKSARRHPKYTLSISQKIQNSRTRKFESLLEITSKYFIYRQLFEIYRVAI